MNRQKILENLCMYDERSPYYDPMNGARPNGCFCDNCFYGRSPLSEALLEVIPSTIFVLTRHESGEGEYTVVASPDKSVVLDYATKHYNLSDVDLLELSKYGSVCYKSEVVLSQFGGHTSYHLYISAVQVI